MSHVVVILLWRIVFTASLSGASNLEIAEFLDRTLLWVEKPSQYIGGEWNSITKDPSRVISRVCLSFPDTYPIGMSYHGLKLLYEIVNQAEDLACERVFIPLPDFTSYLKKYQIPLFTLESQTAVKNFHIWGFSIGSESNWTNVLQMLHLAQIPILCRERTENDPIIIAGGHGIYNPEPGALFLDIVALGDGEELLPMIMRLDAQLRKSHVKRQDRIIELCRQIPGLYAPSFYDVHYNSEGTIAEIVPTAGLPKEIKAAFFANLEKIACTKPLVGYSETVHNRIFLELMRGCTRGCRYCEAGMVYRPLRIRNVDQLVKEATELFQNTGYEEISLYSLASSDYPHLEEVCKKLLAVFAPKGVGLSLPSLRINDQMKILPELIASVRKRTLTLAPEVGTERMRKIINKEMNHEEMVEIVRRAYQEGWDTVKLYFMIGLPKQDKEDYHGIADMIHEIANLRRASHGRPGKIHASIANFVPKPQTPFQWAAMATRQHLEEAQRYIKGMTRAHHLDVSFHDISLSLLEGLLARGNRKIADVMLSAWKNGAYLDAWDEHFKQDAWDAAYAEHKVDFNFYLHREIPLTEVLPWDHLHSGVSSEFLQREWNRAQTEEYTSHCLTDQCHHCGTPVSFCYHKKTGEEK